LEVVSRDVGLTSKLIYDAVMHTALVSLAVAGDKTGHSSVRHFQKVRPKSSYLLVRIADLHSYFKSSFAQQLKPSVISGLKSLKMTSDSQSKQIRSIEL